MQGNDTAMAEIYDCLIRQATVCGEESTNRDRLSNGVGFLERRDRLSRYQSLRKRFEQT
jgi:hypothetical protein